MTTFWQNAKRFPPILVRLLARRRFSRPLTCEEIATASAAPGLVPLTPAHVFSISQNTDWGGIDIDTMRGFLVGCGMDFCNRKQMLRVTAYMWSNPNFKYLRKSPDWKAHYQPMIMKWQGSISI